jgi:hypothetical protein
LERLRPHTTLGGEHDQFIEVTFNGLKRMESSTRLERFLEF